MKATGKWTRILSLILLLALFIMGAVACRSKGDGGKVQETSGPKITVSFDTMGGDAVDSIELTPGTALTIKELPIAYKSGYIFSEWYLDSELKTPFTSSDGVFNSDTTLYASYTEQTVKQINWTDTAETSLLEQAADTVLKVAANGGTLTTETLFDHLTVTNHFEVIELPTLTVSPDGENYIISAEGGWPESGMFTFEFKSPFKFTVEMTDRDTVFTYVASKLYFSVAPGEARGTITEQDFIIDVTADDYYSMSTSAVYLKEKFAFDNDISEGSILKIYDADGNYEIYKATGVTALDLGNMIAMCVTLDAPDLSEVFSEFDVSTHEKITIDDHDGKLDADYIKDQFEANESFEILQNYSLLSAIDYINSKNLTNISGATLRDGTKLETGYSGVAPVAEIDSSSTTFDIYYEYMDDVGPKSEDNIKFICVSGSWRINMGDDTYAIATITVKDGGWIYLGAEGRAKETSSFPWVDIAFSISAGVEAYEVFEFGIVIYHDGVKYDVREDVEVNGHYAPDIMVSRYRTLIGLDDTALNFSVRLYEFNVSVWEILNFGFPVSVEFEFSLNGSFAVTVENNWFHIFGFKGGTQTAFDAHHAELYQEQKISTYYNGMFGVRAGIVMGVRFSVLNLSSIGAIGIDFGVGVYFDFYGYGYTYSEYSKVLGYYQPVNYWDFFSNMDRYEGLYDVKEYEKESGGSYRELGIYIRLELVAESSVFSASADFEVFDFKIPLMTAGDDYVVLGFSDKTMELIETGLTVDKYGYDLTEYDVHKMKVMYLKTGKVAEIELDPSMFEYRGVMWIGSFNGGTTLTVRDDVIRSGKNVTSSMQITYKGGNVYNSTSAIYAYPEVRYLPVEIDETKLGDVYTVTLTLDGEAYHVFEVPYGTSVMYLLEQERITYESLSPSDEWMEAHPNYEKVSWKYADLTTPITEDTVFEEYTIIKYIQIGYSTGYLTSQYNNFAMHKPAYIWTPVGVSLYEVLADANAHSLHENVSFEGWDIEDKILTEEDNGLIATALYDFKTVTVTVEVKPDTLSGRGYGVPGIFTYEVAAGTNPYRIVSSHCGIYGNGYQAYISENASTADLNSNLFDDAYFLIDWDRAYCLVSFYDPFGVQILTNYIVSAYADASWLLDEEAIKSYDYTYVADGDSAMIEFVGWGGAEKLNYITGDVSLHAMIAQAERTLTFDPSGGFFKHNFSNMVNGNYTTSLYWGSVVTEENFSAIEPVRSGTDYISYEFAGWYYLNDSGEKVFELGKVTEDRTYYAEWKETERLWSLTVEADHVSGGIEGIFTDGSDEKISYLTYDEITALVAKVRAGDYSVIPEVPTAPDTEYEVKSWYIAEIVDTGYVLMPYYSTSVVTYVSTEVVWDLGRALNYMYESGVYTTSTNTGTLTFESYLEPCASEDIPLGLFSDNEGYFVFKHWSVIYNGETMIKNTGDELAVAEYGDTVYVTAVYEKVYNTYTYTFTVETFNENNEYWERLHVGEYYYSNQFAISVTHGVEISEADIPRVSKLLYEDAVWEWDSNPYWEYVIDYWECLETGEKFVDMTPDGNRTYKAHFKKTVKTVDVTFYAGENAYFTSTGTSYILFENVISGTELSELLGKIEAPVHNDSDTYEFYSWDTYEGCDMITDATVTAYFWNTEVNCPEGEEHLVYIYLDAGYNGLSEAEERFTSVGFEEGTVITNYYLSAFLVVIDGVTYYAEWDIPDGWVATRDISGTVVTYKYLTPVSEDADVIIIELDAGEDGIIKKSGERYAYIWMYEGFTLTREYMDGYTVIVDGVEYTAVWEGFEEDVVVTEEMSDFVVTYTSITPIAGM